MDKFFITLYNPQYATTPLVPRRLVHICPWQAPAGRKLYQGQTSHMLERYVQFLL